MANVGENRVYKKRKEIVQDALTHFLGRPLGLFSPVASAFCEWMRKVDTDQYAAPSLGDTRSPSRDKKLPHFTLREESHCTSGILCHSSANDYGTISMPSGPMRAQMDSSRISIPWFRFFLECSDTSFMAAQRLSSLNV